MRLRRSKRVASLVHRELAELLAGQEWPNRALVTIEKAQISPDLYHIHIWCSVYPEQETVSVNKQLKRLTPVFQHTINKCLRMRPVPQLHLQCLSEKAGISHLDQKFDMIKKERER